MKRKLSESQISLKKKLDETAGSSTVLLAIVLTTVIMLTISLVILSQQKSQKGRIEAIMSLSGRSVLSEYCVPLKERYGILAVDMSQIEIGKRLEFYAKLNETALEMENMSVNTDRYSLMNLNHLEDEIVEYYKFLMAGDLISPDSNMNLDENKEKSFRTLRDVNTTAMLPSGGSRGKTFDSSAVADGMDDVDSMFDRTKKSVIVNSYIRESFSSYMTGPDARSFFRNEVEYIIAGKKSDSGNLSTVKNRIVLVRNVINLASLMKDPVMMAKIEAVASLAGPASQAAVIALAEAWALAESINDYKVLIHGGKVPVVKTSEEWAVSLSGVAEGISQGYIDNHCETGLDYQDYMQVFLSFMDRETKLQRMLDLIQINLQGSYDRNFLAVTSQTGFSYKVDINGMNFRADENL